MASSDDLLNQWEQEQKLTTEPVVKGQSGSDSLLGQWEQQQKSAVAISVGAAVKGNPDQAAEIQRVAKDLRLPADTVKDNWDDVSALAKERSFQMRQMAADDPVLARQYSDINFAAIAYDDVENLSEVGKTVRGLGKKPEGRTFAGTMGDIGVTALKGAMALNQTIIGLADISTKGWAGKQIEKLGINFKEAQDIAQSMYSPATQKAWLTFRQADGPVDKAAAAIENPSVILTTVGESVPSMFLGAVFAKSLGAMRGLSTAQFARIGIGEGAVGAGQFAEQVRSESPDGLLTTGQVMAALASGGGTGLLGVLGAKVANRLGITDLEAYVSGVNTANPAKNKMIGRQILEGAVAEGVLEELPQSVQEQMWQNVAQEKPVFEGVDDAAVLGLFAGMAMGGAGPIAALPANIREERAAARAAEEKGQLLENLNKIVAANKVLGRDPEAVQNYVEQVVEETGAENVYVKASVLQQSGMAEQIAAAIPSVGEQLRQIVTPDQEIQIPVAEYTTKIAPTEANAVLVPELRVEGEKMTRREAEEFIATDSDRMAAEYDKAVKGETAAQDFRKSAKVVENTFRQQLAATGMFTASETKVQAALYGSALSTVALRLKITPEEALQRFNLQVAKEGQTVAGDMLTQATQLLSATPEFKSWFGNSVLKTEDGKPMTLYHGTSDNVESFDLDHPNRKDTGWLGTGVYLTDSTDMADVYANQKRNTGEARPNVMPLYASLENPYMATDEDKARLKEGGREAADAFAQQLQAEGYDGVIYQAAPDAREIVVFDPAKVKSVFNEGSWSPETANILQQAGVNQQQDPTQTPAFKRWSNDAQFISSEEAESHDFKTGEKIAVEGYHGTGRPDRVGTVFKKSRATSGPMAFFTSSPDLASSYAQGKQDTSLAYEEGNYANWFKYKPKGQRSATDIVRAWYQLDNETKAKIREMAPKLRLSEDLDSVIVEEGNTRGNGSYDYNYEQSKRRPMGGNPLEALVEDWLNSGNLFDDEELFMQVLSKAGFPVKDVTYDSPNVTYPGVYKVFVQMQKPLVTNDVPAEVVEALKAAAKTDRSRAAKGGADMWDKKTRTLKEWVAEFLKEGDNAYVWTSIPDKVTKVFESLGYDGIVDWSGKSGGTLAAPVYIPFSEPQVKSAIGNKGTYDLSKKDILKQSDTFYSALQRAFDSAKQDSMPADQWAKWLTGNQSKLGVKKEEIEATGLREYLQLRGNEKLGKAEILNYLTDNGVQIQEVMKGGSEAIDFSEIEELPVPSPLRVVENDDDRMTQYKYAVKTVMDGRFVGYGNTEQEALSDAYSGYPEYWNDMNKADGTKYGEWTLPGGENYKEMLLTLPEVNVNAAAELKQQRSKAETLRELQAEFEAEGNATRAAEFARKAEFTEARVAELEKLPKQKLSGNYRSAHWDEANILAHIRFNERTDADGKRVLFIEELQSDWAQAARKGGQVLNAPFIKDTKAWVGLAIKRMVRYAAENGFDKLAFVNGQQSADRYDLSKQLDAVEYMRDPDGGGTLIADDINGKTVFNQRISSDADLENYIGKEAANKLMDRKPVANRGSDAMSYVLNNADLKVGGEGMITFYDKIVPQVANDVLKKLGGGKVEQITLQAGKADAETDALYEDLSGEAAPAPQQRTQLGFTITPEMRDTVMAGQSLFQKGDGGARGYIDPKNLMAILTEHADKSTPGHELVHAVVEIYTRIATSENAPAEIVADLQKLLDAYGSGISIDTWAAMSLEDQRPIHEAIAYNWEDYLFTGKAPSIELQSVFDRLSVWIRDLYTSVRDKLNQMYKAKFGVDLPGMTEEVRGVFDRMLASEDQIVQAEAVRNMTPLFQTQEESGMDDATWQAYQQLAQETREESIAKLTEDSLRQKRWLSNAKGRVLKEMQRNTAALRKDMRDKVEAAMQFTPIYKAIRFLKSGEQLQEDGTVQKVSGAHKLSISALRELYGENRPARNRFMDFLVQNGISVKDRSDVGGDKGGKYRPGLFRNDGLRLDELAYLAFEEGYLTEADMQSERDTGGVNKLADLIQRALSGERILTTEQQMAQDEKDVKAQQREQAAAFDAFGEENAVSEEEAMRSMGYTDEQIAAMMATPDWRKLGFGKYGMLAADGIDPDVLAERFGFGSGDELVRTLIATPSLKEAVNKATDEAMLMQYGDMYDKRQIDLAVERALHTEARARFLATELRFIAKATAPARIMVQAAKRAAMNSIAGRLIKDVKPSQYSIAEARANKEAQAAQKKGDDAAVVMALQTALLNNQLTAVATGVVTEIDKGLAYLRKVTSDANRKRIGADHADQIDAILERFELKPISLKEIGRRQSLAEWIESQREAGLDPQIPPDMADAAFRKPFKMMTVQEFRDLMDAIQQIEHLGRNQQMMLTAAKDTAYKAARDEMVASINENAKGRKADTRTAKTKLGKMAQGMQRFFAEHIKAASIARILDGGKDGGPVWEYLIRPANAAADRETEMRAEATRDITAILAPVLKSGKLGGKGTVVRSLGRAFNKEERIAIALNISNEGNLQRLLDGEGWTIEQVTPVLESLTTAELEAVQKILDYSEEKHKPLIAAQWRKLYGKEPEWVAPRAMTVKSADGDMVTLRGGYYPIVYDPRASQRANELYDAESARMEMQGFISATINTSFSKSRVQAVKERPLLLSLAGVYNGINDVIHALAWQEFIIDANRLLRSHSIDQAIRTQYGPEYKQQLKEWIKDVAVGERKSMDGGTQAINFVRQSVSAAGLGFNIMSALQQVTGFSSSIVRLGPRYVGRGVAKTMANLPAAIKFVYSKSTMMANRGRTQFRELNELRNMVQGETSVKRNIKLGTYFMMAQMQRMVDVPTWIGAYEKAIAEGNDEDKAIAMANQSVIDSQGGGMLKDLSKIERGGPWLKLFTVFYSYMNTQLNLATVQAMTAKSKGKLAADMLMLTLVPVVLAYAIKHGLTPDDEDEWDWEKIAKDLAAENLAYLMGSMIIVRELGNAAKVVVGAEGGARGYGGPAGTRMISDLFTFATQAQQGEFDTAFRKAAINLLGDFTGLPSAQINRTINGIDALVEGDTSNPAAVLTGFEKK